MEQLVRDARITQIYEGTNGIQALDLVGRKLGQGTGRLLRRFFHPVAAFIEEAGAEPALAEFVLPLAKAFARLQQLTAQIAQAGLRDPEEAGAAASDYLSFFALVALAYMWARMARVALAQQEGAEAGFYKAKLATARFFMARRPAAAGGAVPDDRQRQADADGAAGRGVLSLDSLSRHGRRRPTIHEFVSSRPMLAMARPSLPGPSTLVMRESCGLQTRGWSAFADHDGGRERGLPLSSRTAVLSFGQHGRRALCAASPSSRHDPCPGGRPACARHFRPGPRLHARGECRRLASQDPHRLCRRRP